MTIKNWIDDIKNNDESGALREQDPAVEDESFPGEREADKILFGARDRIVTGGIFYWTPETRAAEDEVNRTYKEIIIGGKDFESLRKACVRWVIAAQTKPEEPVTADLFTSANNNDTSLSVNQKG